MKEYEFCLRCHRKLRTEEAKLLGYGKVCYKKAHSADAKKNRLFNPMHTDMPVDKDDNM